MLYGLADYKSITFPPLSERQKEIARFALKFVGYPYIWAGEYPTKNSPYGTQKAGGFDCSGFVFYVMKMHFDYPITVNERGAHDMAARAKPRITRKQLQCGDLIFFGPKGPKSGVDVHLPRRPVPRGRLVHPLDRLHGRRHAVVARQLELLQEHTSPGAAACSSPPSCRAVAQRAPTPTPQASAPPSRLAADSPTALAVLSVVAATLPSMTLRRLILLLLCLIALCAGERPGRRLGCRPGRCGRARA